MLHTACITGIKSRNDPEQMIRSYVSSGGDINAKDYEHNTALHLVAEMYSKTPTECVENIYKLLLKYGADPELTNCKNRRPWEMCSMKKQDVQLFTTTGYLKVSRMATIGATFTASSSG